MGLTVQKESRFSIRVAKHQKDVISHAAKIKRTSISKFVVDHSYAEAQKIIAEKTHFELDNEIWAEFIAALDEPPRKVDALKALLEQPGIFDE